MQSLPNEQSFAWCCARDLIVDTEHNRVQLHFDGSYRYEIVVPLPKCDRDAIIFAYMLIMTNVEDDLEENFRGGMVWLQDRDIGSETTERVGVFLFEQVRIATEGERALAWNSARTFSRLQLVEAQTLLALPLLFAWDAYYIPDIAQWFAFVSHEGYVRVSAQTPDMLDQLKERFENGGWLASGLQDKA